MNKLKSLAMLMATASLCLGSQADNDLAEVHVSNGITFVPPRADMRNVNNTQIIHLARNIVEAIRKREIPRPEPMNLVFQFIATKVFRREDGLFHFESQNDEHLRKLTAESMSLYLTLHNHLDHSKHEFNWVIDSATNFANIANELRNYMEIKDIETDYSVSSYALEYVESRPISPAFVVEE